MTAVIEVKDGQLLSGIDIYQRVDSAANAAWGMVKDTLDGEVEPEEFKKELRDQGSYEIGEYTIMIGEASMAVEERGLEAPCN